MKEPSILARKEYNDIVSDKGVLVRIQGTKRNIRIKGIKPYTIERLTRLWCERDIYVSDNSADTLKDLCKEPYFSVKEACLFVLNSYWKIVLLYPIMWRIWGKIRGYTEEQMMPIIVEGKKKIPLTAHWMNMAYSVDMRGDWMKMTRKEAEQYRAELLSEMNPLSLKNTHNMETQEDSSLD